MSLFTVIALGDVVGRPGRSVVERKLPMLREKYVPNLVIVNGENASGGYSINRDAVAFFMGLGIQVVTTGNHVWGSGDVVDVLQEESGLIRPMNYPPGSPGRGDITLEIDGISVSVVNLIGRLFMEPVDCPFQAFDRWFGSRPSTDIIIVDFHGEATSEKQALARYLDGRASLVYGTHTHVQTADEQVLPGGTGYITDIGMSGSFDSVIGMKSDISINRFLTSRGGRNKVASGNERVNGIAVVFDENHRVQSIERIND